jgi:hypothetical protein
MNHRAGQEIRHLLIATRPRPNHVRCVFGQCNRSTLSIYMSCGVQCCQINCHKRHLVCATAAGGVTETLVSLVKNEGIAVLFAGVLPRCTRAVLAGAIQFGSYELTKNLFK